MASLTDFLRNPFRAFQDKPTPPASAFEAEIALADPWRLFPSIEPYNPSSLVTRKGLRVYDAMRKDDQVKASLAFKKQAVLAAGWSVLPPEEKDEEWEPRRFIENQLSALHGTFEECVAQILTSLDYGYSITEIILAPIEDGEFKGKIGLKALKTRRPHEMNFRRDEFGNITDITQRTPSGLVRMPPFKFVVSSYQSDWGNPYGTSDLEAAYRSWWSKDAGYKWLGMLLERFGIPPVFAMYNPGSKGAAEIEALKTVIKRIQAGTAGVIPRNDKDDLELWSPELAGQVARVFIPALEFYNTDIARAILMPGQLGIAPESTVGSMARAQVVFKLFMFAVEALRLHVEQPIANEQLVALLIRLNYPEAIDAPPVFQLDPLTDDLRKDLLDSWADMTSKGVVESTDDDERHIRTMLDFPERDFDEVDDEDDDEDDDLLPPPPQQGQPGEQQPGQPPPQQQFALNRAKNKFERNVNFQKIESELDRLQRRFIDKASAAIGDARDTFISRLARRKLTQATVRGMRSMPKRKEFRNATRALMVDAFKFGRETLASEVGKLMQDENGPLFRPGAAIEHLRAKSLELASTTEQDVLKEVKRSLALSLENGETTREAAERLRETFEPFVAKGSVAASQQKAHRLANIAQTESTAAFNQGRLVEARRLPPATMQGMQYSAILDKRTTEVCEHLNGRVFKMSDPALDQLRPPNHFRCRSILVPITITQDVEPDDFITPSQTGRGVELAGKGFK